MWDEERQRRHQERWERRAARRAERLRYSGPRHAVMGVGLLVIGIVFLLTNLGVIYPEDVHTYWPVILVAFGVAHAVLARDSGRRLFGGIVAAAGLVVLAHNLGYIHGDIWQLLWPVFLIFLGASFLLRALKGGGVPGGPGSPGTPPVFSGDFERRSSANVLNEFTVFGGVQRRIDSQEFEGGEVSAIFGGVEIDLRGAATKKDEVVIELNAIFGGVELRVPDTWNVSVRGAGIFGGYEDKTMPRRDPASGKRPLLVITGSAVFGGVTVM
jgi:predicted membrane protein